MAPPGVPSPGDASTTWAGLSMLLAVSLLSVLALTSMNNTVPTTRTRQRTPPSVYRQVFEELMGSKSSSEEAVFSVSDSGTGFTLQSSSFVPNGYLPSDFTCLDATTGGISPQLEWVYPPMDTQQYMIVMWSHHAGYTCDRYEWVLYGIDASFSQLKAGNPNSVGTIGGTYPGSPKYIYSPPCATGTGNKTYEFTIYALRGDLAPYVAVADVGDDVRYAGPYLVKTALDNKLIIDTATVAVQYNSQRGPPPPIDGVPPSAAPIGSPPTTRPSARPSALSSASPSALPSAMTQRTSVPTRRPYTSLAPSQQAQSDPPTAQPSEVLEPEVEDADEDADGDGDGEGAVDIDVDDPRGPDPNAPKRPDDPSDAPDEPGPGPDVHPDAGVVEVDGPAPEVPPEVPPEETVKREGLVVPVDPEVEGMSVPDPDPEAEPEAQAEAQAEEAQAAVAEVSKEVALSEAAHHAVVHAIATTATATTATAATTAAATNAKKSQTHVRRRADTAVVTRSYPLMTETLMGRNGVPYDLPFDYAADDGDMMECV